MSWPTALRFNIKDDTSTMLIHMEKSRHECSPLDDEGGYQHVEPHTAQTIALHVRHQETKPNEYHHVDILEHWNNTTHRIIYTQRKEFQCFQYQYFIPSFSGHFQNLNIRLKCNVYLDWTLKSCVFQNKLCPQSGRNSTSAGLATPEGILTSTTYSMQCSSSTSANYNRSLQKYH